MFTPEELRRFLKLAEWRYVTDSLEICEGPCYLLDVSVQGEAQAAGIAIVYDGLNASAEVFGQASVIAGSTVGQSYIWPPYFKKGIYVALDGGVHSMTVHFVREDVLETSI